MKVILSFSFGVLLSTICFGDEMPDDPFDLGGEPIPFDQPATSTASIYNISESDVGKFKKDVLAGDADAAFKLSQYYRMVVLNRDESTVWLIKAAELGHGQAQYNLAKRLSQTDCNQAKIWAEKALKSGVTLATELVNELNNKER